MTEQAQPSLFSKIFNEMVKNQSTSHKINNVVMQHQQPELFLVRNPCVINCQDDSSDEDDRTSSATTAQQRRERMRQRRLRRAQFMDYLKLRHRQRSMAEEVEELHRKLASVRNSIADVERALRVHGYNGREVRRLCHVEELERYQQDDMTPDEDEQDADSDVDEIVDNAHDAEDDNNVANQNTEDCTENEKTHEQTSSVNNDDVSQMQIAKEAMQDTYRESDGENDNNNYYGEPYNFCNVAINSVAKEQHQSEDEAIEQQLGTVKDCVEPTGHECEMIINKDQKTDENKTKEHFDENKKLVVGSQPAKNARVFAVINIENGGEPSENLCKRAKLN